MAILAGLWWWLIRRPLAQLDGRIPLAGLKAGVVVDRDVHGTPWIRASSVSDMLVAQGYITASDRLWQMDLLRRAAAGDLAEIFGPAALALDRERRTLGLRAAAQAEANSLDPEGKAMVAAYADGVNLYIEQHRWNLPLEFRLLRYRPRPWTPTDTFLVAGYMYQLLSSTWKEELDRARVTALVGPDRARDMYAVDSPYDRILVGGEAAGGTPAGDSATAPEPDSGPAGNERAKGKAGAPVAAMPAEWRRAQAAISALPAELGAVLGSNNFVVSGSHTYSGKPLLANDTHLPLGVPCIWYINHLSAPGWDVAGFSVPGVPLVIIGHNDRIAWGFTDDLADVQDLYIEKLNPANPRQYLVNGKWVDASVTEETIAVRGRAAVRMEVMRTRHGPVVYRQVNTAYALQWTALEPGGIGNGFPLIGRANNWQQFLDVIRLIPGPAQNAVYADVDGNIGFVVAGRIPIRRKGNGTVPVPGDTDAYGWTGYIPFDRLPQLFNPPGGVIATANGRIVGPGYKYWFTDRWAPPYRTARLYELLQGAMNLRPADCDAVQNDIVSLPDRLLAQQLLNASQLHPPADPEARQLVRRLDGWDGRAVADSVETTFLSYARRALLDDLLKPYLGANTQLYDWWRNVVFVENVLRTRPARWLPQAYPSYDLLLAAAADQAIARLRATRGPREDDWRWGRVNSLELQHPLALKGPLRWLMDIGPVGHDGSAYTVNAIRGGFGPAMRFVSDMGNLDDSLMELTPGESGQYGSRYYRDQFSAWLAGHGLPAPFSPEAEAKARAHELILESAPGK
ncbi:MAG TPA: penicillin acylase family protein [Candidatus Acidoferrales bacterium]|nr:penicillin acylase family protein [Candidatus Acidoferrales bacterium]